VGEGQEHGVRGRKVGVDEMQRRGQVGVDLADGLVIATAPDETYDGDGRVAIEEPDELGADVPGRAHDGDADGRDGTRPAILLGRRVETRAHGRVRPLAVGRLVRGPGWIAVMDA